jgi:hypothetical protein
MSQNHSQINANSAEGVTYNPGLWQNPAYCYEQKTKNTNDYNQTTVLEKRTCY